ncbi:hypothetical protein [Luteimonas cellulosilyticus]|uniref:hypothetical protein n=1 Tax=Luteimonas cellulosilyticus TaxID=2683586 RepID=UPI001F2D0CE7|nr:hypothetical protein [Luteimonas cellulosilyticus]
MGAVTGDRRGLLGCRPGVGATGGVPTGAGLLPAPGSVSVCPTEMRSGLRMPGLAASSAGRLTPFACAMPDSVSPDRTVTVSRAGTCSASPGYSTSGLAMPGFSDSSACTSVPWRCAIADRVSPRSTVYAAVRSSVPVDDGSSEGDEDEREETVLMTSPGVRGSGPVSRRPHRMTSPGRP